MKKTSIVVLIGGNGSNLQALIDCMQKEALYQINGVISHKPGAYGLVRAQQANIPTTLIDHTLFDDRLIFEDHLANSIDFYQPDWIVLAGFMRLLSPSFVKRYPNKILNIHPSLLPKYKGLHTHQRVLDAGEKVHGVTVHIVNEALDDGPIIAQSKVPILPNDSLHTLAERVHKAEHQLYPQIIKWLAEKRLNFSQNVVTLDGNPLTRSGVCSEEEFLEKDESI